MSMDDEDFKTAEPEGRGLYSFIKEDADERERANAAAQEFNSAGKSFCFPNQFLTGAIRGAGRDAPCCR